MLTKDLYAPLIHPNSTEKELTWVGKFCSWVLIALATMLAILLKDTELVTLLKLKFDLLVQLAPMFFVGIHWPRLRSGPALGGLILGAAISVGLTVAGPGTLYGIHAGIYGLIANLVVSIGLSLRSRQLLSE